MSGVQSVGVGATASVLGAQFLPAQGAAGHAAKVALAATGFAAGVYLLAAGGPPAQTQVKGVRLLGARTR